MTPIELGFAALIVLLVFLVFSMPVGVAMAIVGVGGFALLKGALPAGALLAMDFYDTFSSYGLTVIPLFILMSQIVFHAGISTRLFDAVQAWFGQIRGGLAIATIGACAAFGAICGSGPATAATMAAVALPEMRKHRYDPALSAGAVAAGGSLGMLIPPSVVLIVYGVLTEISISRLFIAAIIPSLLVIGLFMLYIFIYCRLCPQIAPCAPAVPWRERWRTLGGVVETLVLFIVVMGGIFKGWFTPTEAAAVGAFGAILIAAERRQLTWRKLRAAVEETIRTSCMVLLIVAGATVFGHFMQITELPATLATWMTGLPLPRFLVFSMIVLFYVVSGCFLDALALVLLTTSIFLPVISRLGFDPLWFGIIIVLVTQIGVISPPVGVNVYVVSGIDRTVPLPTVFRGALPYILLLVLAVAILMAFPQLVTWLPTQVNP